MFKKEGIDAVILKHNIDAPFITHLEQKNKDVKFLRIDAEVTDTLKEEVKEEDAETLKANSETLTEIFKKALNNDKLDVKVERLKDSSIASMMTTSEESRRMQEMMKMYGMAGMDLGTPGETLVLNINHDLVQYVLNHKDADNINTFCEQLYDLAALAHGTLTPDRMTQFITRSNQIMMLLAK